MPSYKRQQLSPGYTILGVAYPWLFSKWADETEAIKARAKLVWLGILSGFLVFDFVKNFQKSRA